MNSGFQILNFPDPKLIQNANGYTSPVPSWFAIVRNCPIFTSYWQ